MKILVADDQSRVRFALRVLLVQQELGEICEAVNAYDLLYQVRQDCPDLLLLSWELPGIQAKSLLEDLRSFCPHLKVIVISGQIENRQVAFQAGADAFASKGAPPEVLLDAVKDLYSQMLSGKMINH